MRLSPAKPDQRSLFLALIALLCSLLPTCQLCLADAGTSEIITLKAEDGQPLQALFTPAAQPGEGKAVILLHMFKQQKEDWYPLIKQLRKDGLTSLAIDMRGHGQSRKDKNGQDLRPRVVERDSSLFAAMALDCTAAYHELRRRGYSKIAIAGASVGCSVALRSVVSQQLEVKGLALLTPGKNYLGLDSLADIIAWPKGTPLLILSSQEEAERGATALASALGRHRAKLVLFAEEDIHGTLMFDEVERVEEDISCWLHTCLSNSPSHPTPPPYPCPH